MKLLVTLSLLLVAVSAYESLEGIESRIAGGQIAQLKQFPYQARLQITKNKNGRKVTSLCGGALISNRTILTAGHCMHQAQLASISLGSVSQYGGGKTHVFRTAWASSGDIIVHENYNGTSMQNDIALVTLTLAVPFNDAVRPVNLPKSNQTNWDNRMGVIAGFGKTGTNAPASKELRFANRRILPAGVCMKPYRIYFKTSMHLCVDGSENISTCPGDSGGPIVVQEPNGSKTVVGLTSFGATSCDKGYPVVFTRVSNYLDWIRRRMK